MTLNIKDIVRAVEGRLEKCSSDVNITGVSTDSRSIRPGEVFFALKGPVFDGHRFVNDVASKGAAGAVIQGEITGLPASFNIIVVRDTLKALGDLARYLRDLHHIPLVAVGGSSGKTTTKEMTASILSMSRRVLKTEGNRNNLIGLPLTLFGLDESFDAAVVELGISGPGEMNRLGEICKPDVALLTNIGRGHLRDLGTIEDVARTKLELFGSLGPEGVRVVNMDDPWISGYTGAERDPGKTDRTVTFSMKKKSDVSVRDFSIEGLSGITVLYDVRGEEVEVRFNSPGECNIINGAAAIAAALPLGVGPDEIREGLNSFSPVKGRMEVLRIGNITVLDDTYNANPDSVSGALKTLSSVEGRTVAVLGDMLELGEASTDAHREAGSIVARLKIDMLFSIGEFSDEVKRGALVSGMKEENIFIFDKKADALGKIKDLLKEGDTVLVKGSRSTGMEEIIEGLKEPGCIKGKHNFLSGSKTVI